MQITGTSAMLNNNLNIGFIGASRCGTCIANYFQSHGLNVGGFYSHNPQSAIDSANIVHTKVYPNLQDIIKDSNVIFISVKDDCIYDVWQQLTGYDLTNKVICHLSGYLPANVFSNHANFGCFIVSMHVPISFPTKNTIPDELKNAYFVLEGDLIAVNTIKAILAITANSFIYLSTENKTKYHAACVMASSLTLSLLDISSNLIANCLNNEQKHIAEDIVLNLANSAVRNARQLGGINEAITGPLIRSESETLSKHMDSISELITKNLYRQLSLHLLDIVNLDENKRHALREALH